MSHSEGKFNKRQGQAEITISLPSDLVTNFDQPCGEVSDNDENPNLYKQFKLCKYQDLIYYIVLEIGRIAQGHFDLYSVMTKPEADLHVSKNVNLLLASVDVTGEN